MFEKKGKIMVLLDPRRFAQRVGMLAVAGIAIFGFIFGQVANATDAQAEQVYYSVSAGDTLWKIASELAPNQDPRDFITQLVELNKLTSASVTPGQRLLLPNS
jgi:hypothetical protein